MSTSLELWSPYDHQCTAWFWLPRGMQGDARERKSVPPEHIRRGISFRFDHRSPVTSKPLVSQDLKDSAFCWTGSRVMSDGLFLRTPSCSRSNPHSRRIISCGPEILWAGPFFEPGLIPLSWMTWFSWSGFNIPLLTPEPALTSHGSPLTQANKAFEGFEEL
ncbi:hypothetical protein PCANC_14453 [Puccinia coronata f. sp. avenae]|uniref:Uncharacterized protein n=1 Tax=Puccinia coronata f. sp. avenae TaxID=200324 RepID=A0A2N5USJ3_9BASI|nr:hypothetical protein PCANC_14453 [Puccinia coronata f. sp. avenae]